MQEINWDSIIDVYCVNVGDKYGPEYVFKLKSAVERHLKQPHNFWCITDKPELYPFSIKSDDFFAFSMVLLINRLRKHV